MHVIVAGQTLRIIRMRIRVITIRCMNEPSQEIMRGMHLLQLADLTRNDIEYALNLYESETFHAPTMMHPVETLLSQGFEQTCKTVLELASFSSTGEWLNGKELKTKYGHDLEQCASSVLTYVKENLNKATNCEHVIAFMLRQVRNDEPLHGIIRLLSRFGRFARYHSLDVVADGRSNDDDPTAEWLQVETDIMLSDETVKPLWQEWNSHMPDPDSGEYQMRTQMAVRQSIANRLIRLHDLLIFAGIQGIYGQQGRSWAREATVRKDGWKERRDGYYEASFVGGE